jgi:protein-disulfide isomerase
MSFDLSYDYRCPFAKNIHLHMVKALQAGADFDVNFIPWTMSQGHKAAGAPDVWDDPTRDEEHLALCVSISVRDNQPDKFLAAHDALYRARHERAIRLVSWEEIEGVLSPLGVDIEAVKEDVATRRPHQVLGESFQKMAKVEAFGVPTFVVNGDATFVRYMDAPTDDAQESINVISTLVGLMENNFAINEFKHTKVSR